MAGREEDDLFSGSTGVRRAYLLLFALMTLLFLVTVVLPWRPPNFPRVCALETPPPPEVKRAPVGAEG
jgi:hypothetical protein